MYATGTLPLSSRTTASFLHKKKMENILSNKIIDRNYLVSLVMQTNLNHLARAFGYK